MSLLRGGRFDSSVIPSAFGVVGVRTGHSHGRVTQEMDAMSTAIIHIRQTLSEAVQYAKRTAGLARAGDSPVTPSDADAIRRRLISFSADPAGTTEDRSPEKSPPPFFVVDRSLLLDGTKALAQQSAELRSAQSRSAPSPSLARRLLMQAHRMFAALLVQVSLALRSLLRLAGRVPRPVAVAGLLVVVTGIAAMGVWKLWSTREPPPLFSSTFGGNSANSLVWATPALLPMSLEALDDGRRSAAKHGQVRAAAQESPAAGSPSVAVAPRRAGPGIQPAASVVSGGLGVQRMSAGAKAVPTIANPSTAIAAPPPPPRVEVAADRARAVPARIYSAIDADVIPPEPIGPRSTNSRSEESGSDTVKTVEIIVNEEGIVESARATTSPRTVAESMFLTAGLHVIKSWQFRPALKDGNPVRYREMMSVEDLDVGLPLRR